MSVESGISSYLDHVKAERGLSRHTVDAYSRDLARYSAYLDGLGVCDPAEITEAQVEGFPVALSQLGLATASIGRMSVTVRGLHKFWAREGVTHTNPAAHVVPPRSGLRLPKALSVADVSELIDASGGRGVDATAVQLCDWALVELLYGTGARISEAVSLDVDDVMRVLGDDALGLRLFGKGSKDRVVPLGSFARVALDAWLVRGRPSLASRNTYLEPALFLNSRGKRLSRSLAFNHIKAMAKRAGLAVEVSPHTLRHSYATHLIDGGADVRVVQELLGHSSVATTQIYTLITVDHLREVYRIAHPRAM